MQHKQVNNHAATVDKHPQGGVIRENSTPQPKMVPRNNEYLEKQSKNSDIRGGPSPAQASDAPESNQIHTALRQPILTTTNDINNLTKTTKTEFTRPNIQMSPGMGATTATSSSSVIQNATDKSVKKILKVRIEQLKPEDFEIMSTNLNEFAKKSPELAIKLGVIKPDDVPQNAENMFSKMKDDGTYKQYAPSFFFIFLCFYCRKERSKTASQ